MRENRRILVPFCSGAILVLCAGILLLLSAFSFSYVALMGEYETVTFAHISVLDRLPGVILWICFFGGTAWLARSKGWQKQFFCIAVALIAAQAIGMLICSTASPVADSNYCIQAGAAAARNEWTAFEQGGYVFCFPYQQGFVALSELLFRVFSQEAAVYWCLQVLNVAALLMMVLSLCGIARRLFNETAAMLLAMLIAATGPVSLYVFFLYGNLLMCGFSCLALWCTVIYLDTDRWVWMVAGGFAIAAAITVKPTALIMLVAIAVVLILHAVSKRSWKVLAAALILVIMAGTPLRVIQQSYALRSGVSVNPGTSKLVYIAMGLEIRNQSYMAPGWYTGLAAQAYEEAGYDYNQMNQQMLELLRQNLNYAWQNPGEAVEFFVQKTVSQWEEPTFDLWWFASCHRKLQDFAQPLTACIPHLNRAYGCLQAMVYPLALVGCITIGGRRIGLIQRLLVPITFVGGFFYLLLSEGKSQYALLFYPLVLWMAAAGATYLLDLLCKKRKMKLSEENS